MPTTTEKLQDFLYLSPSEIYELPSFRPATPCTLPSHTVEVVGAVAGLHLGSLIICGGVDTSGTRLSSCHNLTAAGWEQSDSLPGPAFYAAVSQGPGGLLVTGGHTGSRGTYRTQTYSDAGWTHGPDLPVEVWGHCQVNTGQEVIVLGGDTDGVSARVFSLQGGRWTELPTMSTARSGLGCVYHKLEVWAIGGRYGGTATEIFNLKTNSWRDGPDLPKSMSWGQAVEYEDQLYVIDRDGSVYLYSENAWLKVADIQSYARRPLFPAPVVNRQSLKC